MVPETGVYIRNTRCLLLFAGPRFRRPTWIDGENGVFAARMGFDASQPDARARADESFRDVRPSDEHPWDPEDRRPHNEILQIEHTDVR